MQRLYITVDLGGTSLRMALLDAEGNILHLSTLSSEQVRKPEDLAKVLLRQSQELTSRSKGKPIAGLALGIPGLVDGKKGIVYQSPHFPDWKDLPLKTALAPHLPFPVFMDNDANQAALGEAWKGAGKEWSDFIMLTLGTGIGGGIILDGKIFHGPYGFAGEVGHMVIDRKGLPGALGSQGTLESLASSSGLQLIIREKGKNVSLPREILARESAPEKLPEELAHLARAGNPFAREIWIDFGRALGCGLASLGHAFGIFRFIIGGGLLGAWDLFEKPCRQETSQRSYGSTVKLIEVVRARLGNQAGLIGGVRQIQTS